MFQLPYIYFMWKNIEKAWHEGEDKVDKSIKNKTLPERNLGHGQNIQLYFKLDLCVPFWSHFALTKF